MSTIHRFEEIEAWQTARKLTRQAYDLSSNGAFARDFGLRDQMQRAAVSIMSNIAEGFESRTRGLFTELLGRAKGSAGELRAQLYVAHDAGYLTPDQFRTLQDQCEKCSSQISRLMAYLKSNVPARSNDASRVKRSNVSTFKRSNVPAFKRSNDSGDSGG
jgi:four helix bundle protein